MQADARRGLSASCIDCFNLQNDSQWVAGSTGQRNTLIF